MLAGIDFDENLWFMHEGCEGKHFLIGNPHTYPGRMWAWCPKDERTFFVSKGAMGEMSEAAKYWVMGFLAGNQPEPPRDGEDNEVDFKGVAYREWLKNIEVFERTGIWEHEPDVSEA
jgi:hypothetical protein